MFMKFLGGKVPPKKHSSSTRNSCWWGGENVDNSNDSTRP